MEVSMSQSSLGAGGTGEAYRARDIRLAVAVKVLANDLATEAACAVASSVT